MANIKHFALGLSILSLGLCSYAHAFTHKRRKAPSFTAGI